MLLYGGFLKSKKKLRLVYLFKKQFCDDLVTIGLLVLSSL